MGNVVCTALLNCKRDASCDRSTIALLGDRDVRYFFIVVLCFDQLFAIQSPKLASALKPYAARYPALA